LAAVSYLSTPPILDVAGAVFVSAAMVTAGDTAVITANAAAKPADNNFRLNLRIL
jgi:hypothetical protein